MPMFPSQILHPCDLLYPLRKTLNKREKPSSESQLLHALKKFITCPPKFKLVLSGFVSYLNQTWLITRDNSYASNLSHEKYLWLVCSFQRSLTVTVRNWKQLLPGEVNWRQEPFWVDYTGPRLKRAPGYNQQISLHQNLRLRC